MEPLIIGAVSVGVALLAKARDHSFWAEESTELGLALSGPVVGRKKLHGRLRGFDVVIEDTRESSKQRRVRVEIRGVDPGFTLAPRSALTRIKSRGAERKTRRAGQPKPETGDEAFDERIRIDGDAVLARAMLGPEVRQLVYRLLGEVKGDLQNGTIRSYCGEIREVKSKLAPLLDLAERLRRPPATEIPRLLAERVLEDDAVQVRRGALRQLATSFPDSEWTRSAADELLRASSPELRFEAARVLMKADPEGSEAAVKVLVELAPRRTAGEGKLAARLRSVRCAECTLQRLEGHEGDLAALAAPESVCDLIDRPAGGPRLRGVPQRAGFGDLVEGGDRVEVTDPSQGVDHGRADPF
ncbi:MAG: HEAT repeat domain-containing protein, partial [Acidobacteriota bacterium]